jgi:hypothetical protein
VLFSALVEEDKPRRFGMRVHQDKECIGFVLSLHPKVWQEFIEWVGQWHEGIRKFYEEFAGEAICIPQQNVFPQRVGFGGSVDVAKTPDGNIDLMFGFREINLNRREGMRRLRMVVYFAEHFFTWAYHFLENSSTDKHLVSNQWIMSYIALSERGCGMSAGIFPGCAQFLREVDESFYSSVQAVGEEAWRRVFQSVYWDCRAYKRKEGILGLSIDRDCACLGCSPSDVNAKGGYVLHSHNLTSAAHLFIALLFLAKIFEGADEWWKKKTESLLNSNAV